ncbi:hypothetical protein [Mesorhizobium sp. WSM4312]|nr:hypothetical protein [Mesorhizobium sp. WSM4312]
MSYLTLAKFHWKRGQPLPVDLFIKLTYLGFDVEALERHYSV